MKNSKITPTVRARMDVAHTLAAQLEAIALLQKALAEAKPVMRIDGAD